MPFGVWIGAGFGGLGFVIGFALGFQACAEMIAR